MTKQERLKRDFREYNKLMRRCNSKQKTWEEYVRYRKGLAPKPKFTKGAINSVSEPTTYHRYLYPSAEETSGSTTAKPTKKYTGTRIKGIAVTHKSNLVPISSQEQAIDIANMRRN